MRFSKEILKFYKVWPKVIDHGESESEVKSQKFWNRFSELGMRFSKEILKFYKVWPKVIGHGESKSEVKSQKFWYRFSELGMWFSKEILKFYKVWPKVIDHEESESAVRIEKCRNMISMSENRLLLSRIHYPVVLSYCFSYWLHLYDVNMWIVSGISIVSACV